VQLNSACSLSIILGRLKGDGIGWCLGLRTHDAPCQRRIINPCLVVHLLDHQGMAFPLLELPSPSRMISEIAGYGMVALLRIRANDHAAVWSFRARRRGGGPSRAGKSSAGRNRRRRRQKEPGMIEAPSESFGVPAIHRSEDGRQGAERDNQLSGDASYPSSAS